MPVKYIHVHVYELNMTFLEIVLNAVLCMKHIIIEYYYDIEPGGLPTGTIEFWGSIVLQILRVDCSFDALNCITLQMLHNILIHFIVYSCIVTH